MLFVNHGNLNCSVATCIFSAEDAEDYEEAFGSSASHAEILTVEPGDIDVRVIVPSGQVVATDSKNPGTIYWQHKVYTITLCSVANNMSTVTVCVR
jgi:hypothetical protein